MVGKNLGATSPIIYDEASGEAVRRGRHGGGRLGGAVVEEEAGEGVGKGKQRVVRRAEEE